MPWPCPGKTVSTKSDRGQKKVCDVSKITYGLCDIVDNNGAVCISVVHGRQGLVAFLSRGIPDLELYGGILVKRDGLCEEGSADGGFPVGVELVLQ